MDRHEFARQQRAYQAEQMLEMVRQMTEEAGTPSTTEESNHASDAE